MNALVLIELGANFSGWSGKRKLGSAALSVSSLFHRRGKNSLRCLAVCSRLD
jgi:hypothetical protein